MERERYCLVCMLIMFCFDFILALVRSKHCFKFVSVDSTGVAQNSNLSRVYSNYANSVKSDV